MEYSQICEESHNSKNRLKQSVYTCSKCFEFEVCFVVYHTFVYHFVYSRYKYLHESSSLKVSKIILREL